MRRTKIVSTIGPASESEEMLSRMIDAGMNIARLNFSHGTHEDHARVIGRIRKISQEKGVPVAILQDLSGPKIRIGIMKEPVELKPGDPFTLFFDDRPGDEKGVSTTYKDIRFAVEPGDTILLADGAINMQVVEKTDEGIVCKVVVGGTLSSKKGINLPTSTLAIPSLTEKDRADLLFGLEQGVDLVALSFVRRPGDVLKVKSMIHRAKKNVPVIAKIEKHEAIDAIDEIIEVADGIMIARGDLAVETPLERVPVVQKNIIQKCNRSGTPVITATQMLQSMVTSPRPTRAEAADVANAVLDGSDAVMLSEETTIGHDPVGVIRTMSNILEAAEATFHSYWVPPKAEEKSETTIPKSVTHAAVIMAGELQAKTIVTPTRSGYSARMVARHRPQIPVIALCVEKQVQRQLCIVWGVYPYYTGEMETTDAVLETARQKAQDYGFAKQGDLIIIAAGLPPGQMGTTNLIKVEEIV